MAASQSGLSTSAFDALTSSPSVAVPPAEIIHHGRVMKKIDHSENTKRSSRVSAVWSHGQPDLAVDDTTKKPAQMRRQLRPSKLVFACLRANNDGVLNLLFALIGYMC